MITGRCRLIKDWPEWDPSVHENEEQIARQGRAMTYPFTFKVNAAAKTARFSSTSVLPYYDTSLSYCDCRDFQERQLPCKHIYRLAVELGMIEIIRRSNRELLDEVKSSEDIDSHPVQVKRKENAKGAKMAPISIDYESQTAVFLGSGKKPYETSVDSCTCGDYLRRRLPCKHIYRLLEELRLHYMEQVDSSGNEGDASEEVHSAVEASKSKPSFSCCHLYRECSDARHCINENKEYADNCEYNQHLLAGRIFYGQNANDFSKDTYDHVLQTYSSLSDEARNELDRIIYHCHYTKAGLRSVETVRTERLSELEEKGLIRIGGTVKIFLERVKTRELLKMFPQWKYLEKEVREFNKNAPPDEKTTLKKLVSQYVAEKKPGFEAIDLLTQRFAIVYLKEEYWRYFAEIALLIHERPQKPEGVAGVEMFGKSQ